MMEEEKERERELERAIHEETEAVWQKRLDQWRKERMMRRKLLDEVIAGRRQQVENRCKLMSRFRTLVADCEIAECQKCTLKPKTKQKIMYVFETGSQPTTELPTLILTRIITPRKVMCYNLINEKTDMVTLHVTAARANC